MMHSHPPHLQPGHLRRPLSCCFILFFRHHFSEETLTLITFLAVEQMIFYCCQKETYQWKVHVKLDWKMFLGESKIYLKYTCSECYNICLFPGETEKRPQIGIKKILYSQFLDNGTKQNIKLWLVLVATYMKIKMI